MSDPASVDHGRAADILADIEANPHAAVKSVNTETRLYTSMTIELAVKPDPEAE